MALQSRLYAGNNNQRIGDPGPAGQHCQLRSNLFIQGRIRGYLLGDLRRCDTSGVATNPPSLEIGEVVRVRYIKSNPRSAEIDSFKQLWLVAVVCSGLGIFFAGTGYLLFRYEQLSSVRASQPT